MFGYGDEPPTVPGRSPAASEDPLAAHLLSPEDFRRNSDLVDATDELLGETARTLATAEAQRRRGSALVGQMGPLPRLPAPSSRGSFADSFADGGGGGGSSAYSSSLSGGGGGGGGDGGGLADDGAPTATVRAGVVAMAAIVFLCDYLLLTVVVPILPLVFQGTRWAHPLVLAGCFAAKPAAQILFNPFAGLMVDRHGPRTPLLFGGLVLAASCGVFIGALLQATARPAAAAAAAPSPSSSAVDDLTAAMALTFWLCTAARFVQGFASALASAAGMTLVIQAHDASVRGSAVGAASTGIALGALCGPPLGGLLGTFGFWVPFAALGGLLGVNVLVQACVPASALGLAERSSVQGSGGGGGGGGGGGRGGDRRLGRSTADPELDPMRSLNSVRSIPTRLFPEERGEEEEEYDAGDPAPAGSNTLFTGCRLLGDPLVSITAMASMLANAAVGMIEPLVPLYMQDTLLVSGGARNSTGGGGGGGGSIDDGSDNAGGHTIVVGLVFASATLSYLLLTPVAGVISDRCAARGRRWAVVLAGMVILALSLSSFLLVSGGGSGDSTSDAWTGLVVGLVGIGAGLACIDGPTSALLADIMDARGHEDSFGAVFAVQDSALSAGFAIGPLAGAGIQAAFAAGGDASDAAGRSFRMMAVVFGGVCLLFAPCLLALRGMGQGGGDEGIISSSWGDGGRSSGARSRRSSSVYREATGALERSLGAEYHLQGIDGSLAAGGDLRESLLQTPRVPGMDIVGAGGGGGGGGGTLLSGAGGRGRGASGAGAGAGDPGVATSFNVYGSEMVGGAHYVD